MAKYPIAGTAAQIAYGWETNFNSASASIDKAFSQGVKVTTYDVDNDPEYVYQLGSQDAQISIAKTFKGSWGVEFLYSDPWWLRAILGGPPVDAGSTPYTHTWTGANGGIVNTQPSLSLLYGFNLETDSEQTLTGCICNTASINCNVGEPITVRLEGWFSGIDKDTSLAASVAPVEVPQTFAQGSFEIPNGTAKTDVQSVELTWNRNNDPVYAIGSRFPQQNVPKAREWNLRINAAYEVDTDFWDTLLGASGGPAASPSEAASSELTFTNGGATSAERSTTILFTNTFLSRGSLPSSPEEMVKTDIEARARGVASVVVNNNTTTAL